MTVKELGTALRFTCTLGFWRMTLLWTFSLIISYVQLFISSSNLFSPKSRHFPNCSPTTITTSARPVCIVTGATSGLGAAAACALSKEGFFVVLAGRSPNLLSKAISEIKKRNDDAHLKAFQVDLSSLQSILEFKGSIQQWLLDSNMHPSIQLLINNAGILATTCRYSAEGLDQMMGTNYFGSFALTKVLLPLLENSPVPSRIVNVTSFTHRTVSKVEDIKATLAGKCFSKSKGYPFAHMYEYSKLYLLLFSYELHRQFGLMRKYHHVSVNAADPGAVETHIMREVPPCISQLAFYVLKHLGLLQSPEYGVHSVLDAALAPPEVSGVYFFGGNGRTINSSALSYDTKLSEDLWKTSCDLFLEMQAASKETSVR